jgi:hypothetical protein
MVQGMGFGLFENRLRFRTKGMMFAAFGCMVRGLAVVVFEVGGIEWVYWFGGGG